MKANPRARLLRSRNVERLLFRTRETSSNDLVWRTADMNQRGRGHSDGI
jgi:hypothetical protein